MQFLFCLLPPSSFPRPKLSNLTSPFPYICNYRDQNLGRALSLSFDLRLSLDLSLSLALANFSSAFAWTKSMLKFSLALSGT